MADGPGLTVSGTTRVAGVIGTPVRHSRSPLLVNAAFEAAGLDWLFVAFEVAEGDAPAAVAAMRALGLGGLSVTMPHKHGVIAALDRVSSDAEALGAVNCIAWDGSDLVGHNTDGAGLLSSLRVDHRIDPSGARCVVLGAGGAARSVVRSLATAGAAQVAVLNRTESAGRVAVELAGPVGRLAGPEAIAEADLVVNATSVGMGATPGAGAPLPCDPDLLRSGQVVVDLVYQPLETPLLAAARARGATAVDGLGMLVHQAALAVELWTGVRPAVDAMAAAARA